ncbi:MAG: PqqD family protein [Chloroflexota bacterium]
MLAPRRKLTINETVVCAELDDEMVLLNVETGIYFGLDAVGTQIWTLLTEGATEDEIVARLLDEYEVPAPELRGDVSSFLDDLQAKGLALVEGE